MASWSVLNPSPLLVSFLFFFGCLSYLCFLVLSYSTSTLPRVPSCKNSRPLLVCIIIRDDLTHGLVVRPFHDSQGTFEFLMAGRLGGHIGLQVSAHDPVQRSPLSVVGPAVIFGVALAAVFLAVPGARHEVPGAGCGVGEDGGEESEGGG